MILFDLYWLCNAKKKQDRCCASLKKAFAIAPRLLQEGRGYFMLNAESTIKEKTKAQQVEEEVEEVRRWNTCTNKSGSMRACYDWAPACLVQLGSCSFGTLGLLLVLV